MIKKRFILVHLKRNGVGVKGKGDRRERGWKGNGEGKNGKGGCEGDQGGGVHTHHK